MGRGWLEKHNLFMLNKLRQVCLSTSSLLHRCHKQARKMKCHIRKDNLEHKPQYLERVAWERENNLLRRRKFALCCGYQNCWIIKSTVENCIYTEKFCITSKYFSIIKTCDYYHHHHHFEALTSFCLGEKLVSLIHLAVWVGFQNLEWSPWLGSHLAHALNLFQNSYWPDEQQCLLFSQLAASD